MHVSPAKHSFGKCDRKVLQTDRQTTDKVIPMCRYASQATQKLGLHYILLVNAAVGNISVIFAMVNICAKYEFQYETYFWYQAMHKRNEIWLNDTTKCIENAKHKGFWQVNIKDVTKTQPLLYTYQIPICVYKYDLLFLVMRVKYWK